MEKTRKQKKKVRRRAKQWRENIKIYGPLVIAVVLVVIVVILIYQRTASEQEISYPGPARQWDVRPPVQKKILEPETQQEVQSLPSAEKKFEAPPIKTTGQVIDNNYLEATFSDSFSSLAWVDTKQTTLYFDWTGTNLLFPANIAVKEMTVSPLLDTFVPELVQNTDHMVVLYGHHLLNNQKAVMTWDRDTNAWTRIGFDKLGIGQNQTIISIYSAPTLAQWIIFTRTEQTHEFHVYTFARDMTIINNTDLGTIPQGISIACGQIACLIYYPDSLEFFTLDMTSLELRKEKELQNMVREKNIDSVVISQGNNTIERWGVVKQSSTTPRWVVGLAQEKAFEIWQYAPFVKDRNPISLIFSQELEYPGHLALLPRSDDRIFILWASYFTHAYEIQSSGAVFDLSSRFGWRISENNPAALYEIANTVYITNTNGTIIRFNNEINARIDNLFWFNFSPQFLKIIPTPLSLRGASGVPMKSEQASDAAISSQADQTAHGYVIAGIEGGGAKLYEFTDSGFDLSAVRQVVSKQIIFSVSNIGAAQISGLESGSGQAKIQYYLSNDAGENWHETELGQIVKFENQGNDLRWKIVIAPYENANPYITPYLSSINFTYWYKK